MDQSKYNGTLTRTFEPSGITCLVGRLCHQGIPCCLFQPYGGCILELLSSLQELSGGLFGGL